MSLGNNLGQIQCFYALTNYSTLTHYHMILRVPRGSVVKCLTRNPEVRGSSRTGSSGFFRGSVLGQDASEPSLVLVKPRKDMNIVSCRSDKTEILLKAALNTVQSNHMILTFNDFEKKVY